MTIDRYRFIFKILKIIESRLTLDIWPKAFSDLVGEAHVQNATHIHFRLIKNAGVDELTEFLKNKTDTS